MSTSIFGKRFAAADKEEEEIFSVLDDGAMMMSIDEIVEDIADEIKEDFLEPEEQEEEI